MKKTILVFLSLSKPF